MSIFPNALIRRVRLFAQDISGATALEYALLGSLIAVTIVGICTQMFSKLSTEYGEIAAIFN